MYVAIGFVLLWIIRGPLKSRLPKRTQKVLKLLLLHRDSPFNDYVAATGTAW